MGALDNTVVRNQALAAAVCDLVSAAREYVDDLSRTSSSILHLIRWTVEEQGFVSRAVPVSVLEHQETLITKAIESLPQYRRAFEALTIDPAAVGLMDKFVGSPYSVSIFAPGSLLSYAVLSALRVLGERVYSEEDVLRTWKRIELVLYEPVVDFVILAPLLGLELEEASMELAPSITLERLSDQDLVRCLDAELFQRAGMCTPAWGYKAVSRKELPTAGIRMDISLRRRVCEGTTAAGSTWTNMPDGLRVPVDFPDRQDSIPDLLAMSERVLAALRLLKPGFVTMPGVIQWSESYFHRNSGWNEKREHLLRVHQPIEYTLGPSELGELSMLWTVLGSSGVVERKALQLALRRLSLAIDRTRLDDRLVDLLICAEALLLQDVGAKERGELRFRASLRAGRSFRSRIYEPREVYHIMKQAYDARSAIVHGSEPKSFDLPRQGRVQLPAFVLAFENLMREGTRALVQDASVKSCHVPLIARDEILLPENYE